MSEETKRKREIVRQELLKSLVEEEGVDEFEAELGVELAEIGMYTFLIVNRKIILKNPQKYPKLYENLQDVEKDLEKVVKKNEM